MEKKASTKKKIPWGKIVKIAGGVLMVISIVFVIRYFIQMEVDWSELLQPTILVSIIIGGIISSASVALLSYPWKSILEMLSGTKLPFKQVFVIYCRANLSKYVPGNFMHYAMRNILGKEYEISQSHMAVSSIMEIIILILAGLVLIVALTWNGLTIAMRAAISDGMIKAEWLYIIIAVLIAAIIMVLLYIKRKGYFSSFSIKKTLLSFAYYAAALFINSVIFFLVAMAINAQAALEYPFLICGYYLAAWLIGFVTPGAPGGLGIREYIMLLLLVSFFTSSDLALIVVVSRIANVIGDILAFMYTYLAKPAGGRHKKEETI
ncbi:MAG: hypothetical protein ACOYJB_05545 [Christensenellaceae bacterium]|jgi:uncharacterized membrane protein YbhN (UPF0104 family)